MYLVSQCPPPTFATQLWFHNLAWIALQLQMPVIDLTACYGAFQCVYLHARPKTQRYFQEYSSSTWLAILKAVLLSKLELPFSSSCDVSNHATTMTSRPASTSTSSSAHLLSVIILVTSKSLLYSCHLYGKEYFHKLRINQVHEY